jgi:hypothetical protein
MLLKDTTKDSIVANLTPLNQHCFEFSLCKECAIVVVNLQRTKELLMTLQERKHKFIET